jgi:hypothetical protein
MTAAGSSASTSMQGCEESTGRLKVRRGGLARAPDQDDETAEYREGDGDERRRKSPARRFPEERVDALVRYPGRPCRGGGVKGEEGGRERSSCPGACTDGGLVGLLLGELLVAIAERAQGRQEEQRLAEHAPAGEPQRVAGRAVAVLVREHRRKLRFGEQLERSPRDVDPRAQVPGAEGLRTRLVYDGHSRMPR